MGTRNMYLPEKRRGLKRFLSWTFCLWLFAGFVSQTTGFCKDLPSGLDSEIAKQAETDDKTDATRVYENYGKLPLYFIQNNGQLDEKVRFYETGKNHSVFFTRRGILFSLVSGQLTAQNEDETSGNVPDREVHRVGGDKRREFVRLVPLGGEKNVELIAEDVQQGRVNYFMGNDPAKWLKNVPIYKTVVYKGIYQGVDMRFYGNNRQMEYDIIVNPGANPRRVALLYQGVEGLEINENGGLDVLLGNGKLVQKKPFIYQEIGGERVEVTGKFRIIGKAPNKRVSCVASPRGRQSVAKRSCLVYGFQVAAYDKKYPLVIDPAIEYSTYLGGSDVDIGYGITVDTEGNAYITGGTSSDDFPTESAYQEGPPSGMDVFVTKLSPAGDSLVYSTYIGGTGHDYGQGIALDTAGGVRVTGYTYADDFPTYQAQQESNAGQSDAFVVSLNADGDDLVYSTYLGGDGFDFGNGIAVDGSGMPYVTGRTDSANFPVTQNCFQRRNGGGEDAFVTKLSASGRRLYSTYLGGRSDDNGYGIAVDADGSAYATGSTRSNNFPVSQRAYQRNPGGQSDVFVTKLNASGSQLTYSTYLGGRGGDIGRGIAVASSGFAYIAGNTTSNNFPTGEFSLNRYAGYGDAFVAKLDSRGARLLFSTYLGGGNDDRALGIAIDGDDSAYITGQTLSSDFPMDSAIYDEFAEGTVDAFVAKIHTLGNGLIYSTYLGGSESGVNSGDDIGNGIAVDAAGDVYVTGETSSDDFPMINALYGDYAGRRDAFVVKIASAASVPTPTPTPTAQITPTPTASVTPTPTPVAGTCSIPITGLEDNREGIAAWTWGHALPAQYAGCLLQYAYYYLASRDVVDGQATSGLRGAEGITGFANFTAALAERGYAISDVTVKFTQMSLGNDAENVDWFFNNDTETRYYTGGEFKIQARGEDMLGGAMPRMTLTLDYNVAGDCYDDQLSGVTEYVIPEDVSENSSNDVQALAEAFLDDISDGGVRLVFDSLQPASQREFTYNGAPGAYFEVQSGRIEAQSCAGAEEGLISGFVYEPGGKTGFEGATVSITGNAYTSSTVADEDGYYEFTGLAAGAYTVTFTADCYETQKKTVDLEKNGDEELDATMLEMTEKIFGNVTSANGKPVSRAKVSLAKLSGAEPRSTVTDSSGRYEFDGVNPGKYSLTVTKTGYKKTKQTVTLEECEEKQVDVVLK